MNTQDKNIHILTKRLGETPFQCVDRYKKDNPALRYVPITYAGRLDPMAEGLLLGLSGEAIAKKEEYLNLGKTYEFDVLWEFDTDTSDILGIVSGDDLTLFPTVDEVKTEIKKHIGQFEQKYPAYSSQTVGGKSLIEWSRLGRIREVEIPSHTVELFSVEHLSRRFVSGQDLLDNIVARIGLVNGDFRQQEISTKWKKLLEHKKEKLFTIDKLSADVSGGFYVRQFVVDIAKNLGTLATTYHIQRNRIGEFTI